MISNNKLPSSTFQVPEEKDIFHCEEDRIKQNKLINKIARIAWNIFSVIVFPIGIARLAMYGIKKLVSFAVLPAPLLIKNNTEIENLREKFLKKGNAKQETITTADGVDLDTYTLQHEQQKNKKPKDQKWIVFLNPNAAFSEHCFDTVEALSNELKVNVLTGNYRGVGRSKGSATSSRDLVLDGEAMVQRLLDKGVEPKNILVHGWSLGGAVATEVVANHQEEGNEMSLCVDRSFSNIPDVLKGMVGKIPGAIGGWIASMSGWKFDSVKNFQKIKGKKFTIQCENDEVINYKAAALYNRLPEQERPKHAIKPKVLLPENAHITPIHMIESYMGNYFTQYKKIVQEALCLIPSPAL